MTKSPAFMELLEKFFSEYMPYSEGHSINTIRSYKYAFRLLFEYLYAEKKIAADKVVFKTLDFDTVNGFLLWLENHRKCSAATRNLRLSALSSFAKYAQNRNLDAATAFMNGVKKVPSKNQAHKPRTMFSLEEVAILLQLPNRKTAIGMRDYVMLNLMYAGGARAQEVCDLTVRDVQFQKDVTKLTIMGKNDKMRRINIPKPCGILLKQYLAQRGIQNSLDAHIFSSQTHEHMTTACIRAIYKKYLKKAREQNPKLFSEKYSPHSMRHTTATHMIEAGIPLMAIKNFLGHASIMTTEIYAELSQNTVNRHIRDWNEKWFPQEGATKDDLPIGNALPGFLK